MADAQAEALKTGAARPLPPLTEGTLKLATLVTTVRLWDRKSQRHVDKEVRVEADLPLIAQALAERAYANKSKVAKQIEGCVRVYAVTR